MVYRIVWVNTQYIYISYRLMLSIVSVNTQYRIDQIASAWYPMPSSGAVLTIYQLPTVFSIVCIPWQEVSHARWV